MNEQAHTERDWPWPDDYVSLDRGAVWVRSDCLDGFRELGWDTLDAVMQADQLQVISSRRTRESCLLTITTDDGPVRGYLKRHRVRTRDDWRRERGVYRAADTPGLAEARAVGWCQAAGVRTMQIIAAGSRRNPLQPRQSDSFFLSEELRGCVPACDLWHDTQVSAETRERALVAIAETTRRLHAAGLFHYDLYLDHFFVSPEQLADRSQPPTVHLLDLQRVERLTSPFAAWRAEVKDLAQFYGSCRHHGVSGAEHALWADHYFAAEERPVSAVGRSDSAKLTAAAARWELRQLRRRVMTQVQRAGTLFS